MSFVGAALFVTLCIHACGGQEACGTWDYADPDRAWPLLQCDGVLNQCSRALWPHQSPVRISSPAADPTLRALTFSAYSPPTARASLTDRTIRLDFAPSSNALLNSEYRLFQAHLHVPGENVVGGEGQHGAVIHFVHRSVFNESEVAVLALSLKNDTRTMPWLQPVFEALPLGNTSKSIDLRPLQDYFDQLKGANKDDYYTYMGSLTTPPCTEGIRWYVMGETEGITSEDIELFVKNFGHNSRPTQRTLENVAYFSRTSAPPASRTGIIIGTLFGITLVALIAFIIYKRSNQDYHLVKII